MKSIIVDRKYVLVILCHLIQHAFIGYQSESAKNMTVSIEVVIFLLNFTFV
jgi:hypothetical protein